MNQPIFVRQTPAVATFVLLVATGFSATACGPQNAEENCPPDTFRSSASQACVPVSPPCAPGTFEGKAPTETRDRTCLACSAGRYCAGGDIRPLSCLEGVTWDHDADPATTCSPVSAPCGMGTFESAAPLPVRDRECSACSSGEFCLGGDTPPSPCPRGTFDGDGDPATACEACSAGEVCTGGGAHPVSCEAGATWDHDGDPATACVAVSVDCIPGTFESAAPTPTGDRSCTPCAAGEFCQGGARQPEPCETGVVWDHDGDPATRCTTVLPTCPLGTYETAPPSPRSNRQCTTCGVGEYCAGGSAPRDPCVLGSTFDADEDPTTRCVAVSPSCSPGSFESRAPSLTRNRVCAACDPGAYCAGGIAAIDWCTPGIDFDHDLDPATACVPTSPPCPAGTITDTIPSRTQDRSCTACVAGEYCPGGGSSAMPCPSDRWEWDHDGDPATACVLATLWCPSGTFFATGPTPTTDTVCTPCSPGEYCSGSRNPPESCLVGTTFDHDLDPSTPCVDAIRWCSSGTYESAAPSVVSDRSCTACSPGEYCPIGALAPEPCRAGTEDEDRDPATRCRFCVAGEFCAGGAVLASPCLAGTTWDDDRDPATACAATTPPCPAGTIEDTTPDPLTDRSCASCPIGTFCPGGNSTPIFCDWRDTDHDASTDCEHLVSIATGHQATCALGEQGSVTCWGRNLGDVTNVPLVLPARTVQIATGYLRSCAVSDLGDLTCWGDLDQLEPVPPHLQGTATQVEIGSGYVCALDTFGAVTCWGRDDQGQASPPLTMPGPTVQISAGDAHACAVSATGEVTCWGANGSGQTSVPATLPGATVQVSAGYNHTCSRTDSGTVDCWGSNNLGQSTPPSSLNTASDLVAGTGSSLVLDDLGNIEAWGLAAPLPPEVPHPAVDISISGTHYCARGADDRVFCWSGPNLFNERTVPQPLPTPVTRLAAITDHACAMGANGDLHCWGDNYYQETAFSVETLEILDFSVHPRWTCLLGADRWLSSRGEDTNGLCSPPAPSNGSIDSFDVGADHACAVTTTGGVECWGDNSSGQCNVPPLTGPATSVSIGSNFSCALLSTGQVACWGDNSLGQVAVPALPGNIARLATEADFACALSQLGDVTCWGSNTSGQTSVPATLPGTTTDLVLTPSSVCALGDLGDVTCWGTPGELLSSRPALPGVTQGLSLGQSVGCALSTSGQVTCWKTAASAVDIIPPALPGTTTSVTVGNEFACALSNTGDVTCWGSDSVGQTRVY